MAKRANPEDGGDAALHDYLLLEDAGADIDRTAFLKDNPGDADALSAYLSFSDEIDDILCEDSEELPNGQAPTEKRGAVWPSPPVSPPPLVPKDTPHTTAPKPQPGDLVAGYRLLAILGQHATDVHFRAEEVTSGELLTLRFTEGGEDFLALVQEHLEVHRHKLKGLSLVPYSSVGIHPQQKTKTVPKQVYLRRSYVNGISLAGMLGAPTSDKVSRQDLLGVLIEAATALSAAHQVGVFHGGLCPNNVILGEAPPKGVFLTDGAAGWLFRRRSSIALPAADYVSANPAYLAPETVAGKEQPQGPADVYALGAILFEILVGHPPYVGQTPMDILLKVVRGKPQDPLFAPQTRQEKALFSLCKQALHRDPGLRPLSALVFAQEVAHLSKAPKGGLLEQLQLRLEGLLRRKKS